MMIQSSLLWCVAPLLVLSCVNPRKASNVKPPPTQEERAVYCLDVSLSWNGQPIEGGRLPVYGMEVPNVSYAAGHEPARSRAMRLSGMPLLEMEALYVNNRSQSLHLLSRPNLPLEEGALEVTLSLQRCPVRESWPREMYTTAAEASRTVRFCEPVPEWQGQSLLVGYREQHAATLAPDRPVRWSLTFGAFAGTAAPAVPERAIFIERSPEQSMEISITRPANQAWEFDWMD
jgi:hypothetical protein